MSVRKIEDGGVIVTLETGKQYLIRKHYQTRRSKTHTGWDVLWERNGEWFQPMYFSHYTTKAAALAHIVPADALKSTPA